MFRNNLLLAVRALIRFKGFAFINLAGLSLGLATGMLILTYVMDELSFDDFHVNADRIYRVETIFTGRDKTGSESPNESNGWPVGMVLNDFPEVESVLYSRSSPLLVNFDGKRIREQSYFVSPEFFSMFSFDLIEGDREKALTDPWSVVISQKLAAKYFNGQDPLNKTMILADTLTCTVRGVMADMPSNSHIQADMLVSFASFQALNRHFNYNDGWGNINMHNYVLLKKNVDVASFAGKAKSIYMDRAGDMMRNWGVTAEVRFSPLRSIYLHSKAGNSMGPISSISRVYIVSGIAVFVILLACINFINLATARSVYRAREVGLRKVVGSSRWALIRQFLMESLLLTLISFVLAVGLVGEALPFFNELIAKNYHIGAFMNLRTIGAVVFLIIAIATLAGYYPALVMSAMKPIDTLKGKMQGGEKGVQLRRGLVVFQFFVSVCFVAGTFIVINQLDFMQRQALGFAKDEIFVINAGRISAKESKSIETFRNDLQSMSVINHVTYANGVPGHAGWGGQVAYPEGHEGENAVSVEYLAIDENYITTLGLTIIAGRNFDLRRPADLTDGLILNETAVRIMGWESAQAAIGKKITSPSGFPAGEVIGVIKDYHQAGLQQQIGAIAMDYNPGNAWMFAVQYKAADTKAMIAALQKLWKERFPGYDFDYFFLDQDFEKQYQAEQRLGNVFVLFSCITILIAVIGLVGLVSFMTVSRTKEIGIRKVLGATPLSITRLLSGEFVKLVIVANVIGLPLTWYLAGTWLEQFAFRMTLTPGIFVITGAIAVLITLAAVSVQTIRSAMANPVNSLRHE